MVLIILLLFDIDELKSCLHIQMHVLKPVYWHDGYLCPGFTEARAGSYEEVNFHPLSPLFP